MKLKVQIYDADYFVERNRPIVRLFCLTENGEKVVLFDDSLAPYFYVLPKKGSEEKLREKILKLDEKVIGSKIIAVKPVRKIFGMKERVFLKIFVENPRKITKVRDAIKEWPEVEETYEYNINFYRRFLIDKRIKPMCLVTVDVEELKGKPYPYRTYKLKRIEERNESEIRYKVLAFDTEWVEKNGDLELIMLSLASSDGFKRVLTTQNWENKPEWVETLSNERKILERFNEIVKEIDPVFLVGYNSDNFDFAKLRKKHEKTKFPLQLGKLGEKVKFVRRGRESCARIAGIVHIDIFTFINNILSASLKSEVLTLDEVSKELLGEGKVEMEYKEMVDIWKSKGKRLTKLAEYSLRDSILTLKLAELILPQIFSISRLVGEIPFDCSRETYSQLVEQFFIRKSFEENRIIPNSPKTEEKERRRMQLPYRGAIVIEPEKGIHKNIVVFDFRSLYPTIIVTHNISPETLNCEHEECKKENKVPSLNLHFCKKVEGFFPRYLKLLIELRKQIKKKMKSVEKNSPLYTFLNNEQYSLKIIANSTYGYFAFIGARWYSRECAQATAAFGRYYITKSIELLKKEGCKVIYGDTDSVFFTIPGLKPKELLKKSLEILEKVNKTFPGIIELEFRGLYKTGIFVARERGATGAKKRYALLDESGNLEIRGFEVVRRDWCKLAKEIQRKVLELVLKNDVKAAMEIVRETIRKIKERKVRLDDLIIYEQITRPLSQYEQIGPHVKAAMKARDRGIPVVEGRVIGYIIVKGSGSISDRAEPAEFVSLEDYDIDYYINHQILPASMRVFKALGIKEDQILAGEKQKGLYEFFKN